MKKGEKKVHYIIIILIALFIISALINFIKEHIGGIIVFILICGAIVGLVYLGKRVNLFPILAGIAIIAGGLFVIVSIIAIISGSIRRSKLEKLKRNIRLYMSNIGPEANYEKLKNDMLLRFGNYVVGEESSNDYIQKLLDSYVKRNTEAVNDGIRDTLTRVGMIDGARLYSEVNSIYGRYCVGESSIKALCDSFTKSSCEKYDCEGGAVYKLPGATSGTEFEVNEISDTDLESMDLVSIEADIDDSDFESYGVG